MTIDANVGAAASMIKGATIAMGDGSYFDFLNPAATTMTVEDYAYALAYTVRSRGQMKHNGRRCFYGVAQHCVHGAEQMLLDGHDVEDAFGFLMHESDEQPLGDMVGPAKGLPELAGYKQLARRCGDGIDHRFQVNIRNKPLVKLYDIRMLATEKRDMMAFTRGERWTWTEGYEPFDRPIVPDSHPDRSAERFIDLYRALGGIDAPPPRRQNCISCGAGIGERHDLTRMMGKYNAPCRRPTVLFGGDIGG